MPMYHRAANAVLLIFDLTKYATFTHIKSVLHEFRQHSNENVVLALIGNKIDLIDQREVSEDEAQKYAELIGASYHETSALQDIGIDEVFQTAAAGLVRLINEGRSTNMKVYDCSRPVDKSRDQVLKLLNEQNRNKIQKRETNVTTGAKFTKGLRFCVIRISKCTVQNEKLGSRKSTYFLTMS
ncbi:ras-related protein Rab11A-like [Belonocnema kinseyi]|uniref:ras-related protein Rab11A-like n=1 Tax=Belonocnema kinseyi TaxID=2817044 RepID=UPI00143DC9CB|nr:ras-related protein Rab11A-like [Belonocnema kinseyi]